MKRIVKLHIFLLFLFPIFLGLALPAIAQAAKEKEVKPFSVKVEKKTKVFAKADKKAKVIDVVAKGDEVTVLAVRGNWCKVRTERRKVGYARQSEVGKISDSRLTPAAGVGVKPDTPARTDEPKKPSVGKQDKPQKPEATSTDRTDSRKPDKPSSRETETRKPDKPAAAKPDKPANLSGRTAEEDKPKPSAKTPGSSTSTTVGKQEEKPTTPSGVSSQCNKSKGPSMCASVKAGVGFPFLEAYTLGLEADYSIRLIQIRSMRLFGTAAVGVFPLGMARPLGDKELDLEGYWVPIHAGLTLQLDSGKLKPYLGLGVGGHLYGFDINPEETDLELDEDDDGGRDSGRTGDDTADDADENDTYEVSGFGYGGRALAGLMFDVGAGNVMLEAQLYGHSVEDDIAVSFALFLGYHLCW